MTSHGDISSRYVVTQDIVVLNVETWDKYTPARLPLYFSWPGSSQRDSCNDYPMLSLIVSAWKELSWKETHRKKQWMNTTCKCWWAWLHYVLFLNMTAFDGSVDSSWYSVSCRLKMTSNLPSPHLLFIHTSFPRRDAHICVDDLNF